MLKKRATPTAAEASRSDLCLRDSEHGRDSTPELSVRRYKEHLLLIRLKTEEIHIS